VPLSGPLREENVQISSFGKPPVRAASLVSSKHREL